MKVTQNGKEVKNATVAFDALGTAHTVTVDGVNYDPKGFEFEEEKTTKKTKTAKATAKKTKAAAKNDNILTTENTPTK